MIDICNSYLEIDLGEISRNIEKIRTGIGTDMDIIAVLKGNAYGTGLVPVGSFMHKHCGIKTFACAQTFEAVQLRETGIDCDIMVMGGVPFHNIPAVVKYDIQTPAYNSEYLVRLNQEANIQQKTASVQIKIETGLNRIGVLPGKHTDDLCDLIDSLEYIKVTGAYTHFTESERPDKTPSHKQLKLFKTALEQIKKHEYKLKYIHAANTAASTWLRDPSLTHVRPAGLLFGFDVNIEPKNLFDLNEAVSWRTFVTNVKEIKAGESVGYNHSFIAKRPSKIATISAGYGDGYNRQLAMSGTADALVNGKRVPIIGICMDQTFLDVTGIDVKVNDTVTLIGKDGDEFISIFELQKKMNQTYLAILAVISGRVLRIYNK